MRYLIWLTLILIRISSNAQTFSYSGTVLDEKGQGILYATVALLDQEDSTLLFYAVTNTSGDFEIKNISPGAFIMQTSFLGYKVFYRTLKFPSENNEKKTIVLNPLPVNLPEAEVSGDRIPMRIKGDTIEYDAASYKTQPDAVVEDLLKKLPGVEVDRNGNIKAQGEEVKKVTVDGKDFFGNDPKIATRNLPADAVKNAQVFDTKSDNAELTGIDDGVRDKTINLNLKDDRKKAWFGEIQAGAGSKEHYQSLAKAFRFTPEKQFAVLGMLNNVNKFGFSFKDYLDFNGGLGNGESFSVSNSNTSFPIDYGAATNGLITSGAGGINFSSEKRKDNRMNVSYLANGINKKLDQQNVSTNFTDDDSFTADEGIYRDQRNRAHRIDFGWKNRIDTTHTLSLKGEASVSDNKESAASGILNSSNDVVGTRQVSNNLNSGRNLFANFHSGFLKKMYSKWKLISIEADGTWNHTLSHHEINSLTQYFSPAYNSAINQYQQNENDGMKYSVKAGITRKTGGYTYLEGIFSAGGEGESYSRRQGHLPESDELIDSLGAELEKQDQWLEPKIKFRLIKDGSQLSVSVAGHFTNLTNAIDNLQDVEYSRIYFLPSLNWEWEYRKSRRLRMMYQSTTESPQAASFFPVTDYTDPLHTFKGNQSLRPELHHDVRMHWSVFDQFSFSSVFAGLRFAYIKDKISWSKTIDNNLVQHTVLLNVPEDYEAGVSAEYSTPVKKLGVNLNLSVDEKWNQTLTYINDVQNKNSGLTHEAGFSIDNRKKNKWEVSTGINFKYFHSLYSLPDVARQKYQLLNAFTDINFNPDESWHFSLKADLNKYYGPAFSAEWSVPLLQAEMSYSFLKNKRGTLTLSAFDLLNRNNGIERISEYNYVLESRSDIIKRYVTLSFRYKLNKFTSKSKVDVKVR